MAKAIGEAMARVATQRVENMEFEIQGLEYLDEGRFILRDVPVVDVNWISIGHTLEDAGIEQVDAERYVEKLVMEVTQGQLAKIFAQRAKRIG